MGVISRRELLQIAAASGAARAAPPSLWTRCVQRSNPFGMREFQMKSSEWAQAFRLVACDRDGFPSEQLGELPQTIRENCEATAALYGTTGFTPPWISYLACFNGAVVGGGAFVGPPKQNRVEIAYFTLPEYESKGMASQTASTLVGLARKANPSIELFAKTLPELNASTTILSRLGFRQTGSVVDDDIGEAWAWLLIPPAG